MPFFGDFQSISRVQTVGANTTITTGTIVTTGFNSKGNLDLIGYADYDSLGFIISAGINSPFSSRSSFLIDVWRKKVTEPGGTLIIKNLNFIDDTLDGPSLNHQWYVPLTVMKGDGIHVSGQSNENPATVNVTIQLLQGDISAVQGLESSVSIGANEVTTGGTLVPSSVSDNAKGDWIELGTATEDLSGFLLSVTQGSGISGASNQIFLDVAYGLIAPSKEIIVDLPIYFDTSKGDKPFYNKGPYMMQIPATMKIYVRQQSRNALGDNSTLEVILHGLK